MAYWKRSFHLPDRPGSLPFFASSQRLVLCSPPTSSSQLSPLIAFPAISTPYLREDWAYPKSTFMSKVSSPLFIPNPYLLILSPSLFESLHLLEPPVPEATQGWSLYLNSPNPLQSSCFWPNGQISCQQDLLTLGLSSGWADIFLYPQLWPATVLYHSK